MSWTTPKTWNDADVPTAAEMNVFRDNLNVLNTAPQQDTSTAALQISNVYQEVQGISIDLPYAGTYLVTMSGWFVVHVNDDTESITVRYTLEGVASSETIIETFTSRPSSHRAITGAWLVTAAATNDTLKIEAKKETAATSATYFDGVIVTAYLLSPTEEP